MAGKMALMMAEAAGEKPPADSRLSPDKIKATVGRLSSPVWRSQCQRWRSAGVLLHPPLTLVGVST